MPVPFPLHSASFTNCDTELTYYMHRGPWLPFRISRTSHPVTEIPWVHGTASGWRKQHQQCVCPRTVKITFPPETLQNGGHLNSLSLAGGQNPRPPQRCPCLNPWSCHLTQQRDLQGTYPLDAMMDTASWIICTVPVYSSGLGQGLSGGGRRVSQTCPLGHGGGGQSAQTQEQLNLPSWT